MAVSLDNEKATDSPTLTSLIAQGFVTAIANPKGWAFFIALLPPFIDVNRELFVQLSVLVGLILILEFSCLCLYALSGSTMRHFLQTAENVRLLNRIAGTLMLCVAIWLAFG